MELGLSVEPHQALGIAHNPHHNVDNVPIPWCAAINTKRNRRPQIRDCGNETRLSWKKPVTKKWCYSPEPEDTHY